MIPLAPYSLKPAMSRRTVKRRCNDIECLLDDAARSHKPVRVEGKRNNGVLVSEQDWFAIQETLYLLSVPGMGASIKKGMRTSTGDLSQKLRW